MDKKARLTPRSDSRCQGFALLALASLWLLAPGVTLAQTLPKTATGSETSELQPVACVLRGQHPRIEIAGHDAHSAELQFRAENPSAEHVWYGVEVAREHNRWVAILPRPTTSTRLYYRLVTYDGTGQVAERLPVRGAFLADVVTVACDGVTAPTEAAPAITLTVPPGKDRIPEGFDSANIATFVTGDEKNDVGPSPKNDLVGPAPRAPRYVLPTGTKIRVTDKSGVRTTGTLAFASARGLELSGQHLGWPSIARVEAYEPADAGDRLIGALAGLAGGFALSILYYVTVEDAESKAPLYLLTLGAAALGAAVPSGSWRQVDPVSSSVATRLGSGNSVGWLSPQVTVLLRPGGAQVGLTFAF